MNGKVETFSDLYDLFLDRATNTLRLKENTIILYGQTVKKFSAWADAEGITPQELRSRDALTYINGLRREDGKPYAINSLRAHTRDLKTMLTFAHDYEYIPRKIKVETPKLPKVKIEYLSDEDQARVLDLAESIGVTKPREGAIVYLLMDTGLRAAEFVSLNWDQITWDEESHTGTIKDVLGKGDKYRDVYFGPRSWHYLTELKRELSGASEDDFYSGTAHKNRNGWHLDLYSEEGPVFWRWAPIPQRLGTRGLAFILNKMGRALDLHLHPHKFRHTAIRNMVRRNMPLQAIMQVSGHSSLKMIEHYSRLESDDVQNLYASAMNGHGESSGRHV